MLTALRLSTFRCYPALRWDIPAEGALLLGDNAQGKTSLMESICLALTLHSPRSSRLDLLAQNECGQFGIAVDTIDGRRKLIWRDRKLQLSVNDAPRRDYADYLTDAPPVVWLSNQDMRLITGAAEERRKYLDFLGTQWHPAYGAALHTYKKALKSRNHLLRNPRHTRAALHSYAQILSSSGEVLRDLRAQLVELLQPQVHYYHKAISGISEQVSLTYLPSASGSLPEALEAALENDERAGFTTVGPHRDDIALGLNGRPAADYASEGQQRTYSIALLLAQSGLLQAERGQAPVLLIDDVFGELDPNRRKALLQVLTPDSQVFITTTHLHWLEDTPPGLPVLKINQGTIQ